MTHHEKYDAVFFFTAKSAAELEAGVNDELARIIDHYIESYTAIWGKTTGVYQRTASSLHLFDSVFANRTDLVKAAGDGNIELFKTWLTRYSPGRRWLIILDDYDDPKSCNISSLLPNNGVGHVLITSKNPAISAADMQIEIPQTLSRNESVDLLKLAAGPVAICCPEEPSTYSVSGSTVMAKDRLLVSLHDAHTDAR